MPDFRIGTVEDGSAATLDPRRFNRHTFWCGQSGSGKTYALGVILEQLLLQTELPILVLDPNGDFVGLGTAHDAADPEAAARIGATDVHILRPHPVGDGEPLRVRFSRMDIRSKAATLRLDPLADPDEFNLLLREAASFGDGTREGLLPALYASEEPGPQRLARRIENLGVLDWSLWAWGPRGAEDLIDERPRATVLDMSGFEYADEPKAAALAVLDRLWQTRAQRRPILIVIDEAHNLCPPDPVTPLERALTERIVQIAAEGRKYGLWLLLSTQRPSKIHQNVITQCDNLALMKLSSPRDLDELGGLFGYAPQSFLDRAPRFAKGQGLFAGGFVEQAMIVQMADRITREGGADVAVPIPVTIEDTETLRGAPDRRG